MWRSVHGAVTATIEQGRRWAATIAIALVVTVAMRTPAVAAQVKIPLVIDYVALDAAIKQQIYTSGGGRADIWQGADDCQYFYVENPRFGRGKAGLMLDTDGELSLGVAVAGRCLSPIAWSGIAEVDTAAYISGLALKLRVTDVNLYGKDHRKSIVVGRGFDLIKSNLVPRLETFTYDLGPAVRRLEALAEAAATPENSARVRAAMATLRIEPQIEVEDEGIRVTVEMMVPEGAAMAAPAASAAPLTPAEVAAWRKTLANSDAFFAFAIKQLGMTVGDAATRDKLFAVLIDGRERLVQALAQPPTSTGPDPVRILFLDEWSRLRAIIRNAAQGGMLGDRALEFLSFISAGDALMALDQAAPALGMKISADDLRRLAHIMAPEVAGDPLEYGFGEDPELRKIFGMAMPPETAGPLIAPDESEAPEASPEPEAPSPEASPAKPRNNEATPSSSWLEPGGGATLQFESAANAGSVLRGALEELGPCSAYGAESGPTAMLTELGRALRGVVVDERNADRYRMHLNRLLGLSAQHEIEDDGLAPSYRKLYPVLIKTVAWQESCWRQFVVSDRRIWYLESKTGDIGLMQVNKYVWRGFYSLPRLRWDIVYNCGAGAEILTKLIAMMQRHAKQSAVGDTDAIARSVYAAYNGGPGAFNRWRGGAEKADARAADEGFRLKFRAMMEGQSFDIVRCATEWDHAHGQ